MLPQGSPIVSITSTSCERISRYLSVLGGCCSLLLAVLASPCAPPGTVWRTRCLLLLTSYSLLCSIVILTTNLFSTKCLLLIIILCLTPIPVGVDVARHTTGVPQDDPAACDCYY